MATLWAAPAAAQLNGENLLGDMGVKSGTQPAPGVYVSTIYYRYVAETIKDANGKSLSLDPSGAGRQTINAGMPALLYVSPKKVLGAHFGMMAVLPVANGALEAPGFGFTEEASNGLSDLYVMPAQLGWHSQRADAIVGVGFFAPTGRHTAGASDNLGKGMWSYEVSAGGTVYLDSQRSLSLSSTAFWETHGKKNAEVQAGGAMLSNVRVGQLLTVEGGAGKSFLNGAATFGVAYYAQWKITADEFDITAAATHSAEIRDKHRVFGVGPDVTIPIATKTKLISLVNVRYLWEQGAQFKTQGQTLMVTTTFPWVASAFHRESNASRIARANRIHDALLVFYHLLPAPDGALARNVFANGVAEARHGSWTIADDGSVYTLPVGSTDVRLGALVQ